MPFYLLLPAPLFIYKELSVLSRLSIQPKPLHD